MKQSLRKKILHYLTGRNWVNGMELEKRAIEWGYKPSNCSRRCRELAQMGLIDRKIENKCVFYKLPERPIMRFNFPKISEPLGILF